jgi:hypothetical protein
VDLPEPSTPEKEMSKGVLETLGIIGFGPSMSVVLFQSQSLQ